MPLRSILLCSLLTLPALNTAAQLVFTKIPADLQMFPRDKDNQGNFIVAGSCSDHQIEAVRLVLKGDKHTTPLTDQLLVPGTDGSFSAHLFIPAALEQYELRISSIHRNQQEVPERTVKQLVAGDFFIVTGQSNAADAMGADAAGYREDSLHANKYCRTIGTLFQYAVATQTAGLPNFSLEQDCKFAHVSSIYTACDSMGCVGIWPIHILDRVVQQTGIPVCMVNGAMGATFLKYHLASHTPSDPGNLRVDVPNYKDTTPSPYDRLFKKLFVNQATEGIKAIFWYQGENDATLNRNDAENYNKRFAQLRASWKVDYPNLEKIFVCQINTGCGGPYVSLIRDQQRKLAKEFEDVIVFPTVGSRPEDRSDDLCHYTPEGYRRLGEKLAPVVLKYLYGAPLDEQEIMGPFIERAYYTKVDEICLEFDKAVTVQQTTNTKKGTVFMNDYFYKEWGANIQVKAITAEENRVYLHLKNTYTFARGITYLPDIFSNVPDLYVGPWIVNKKNENIGALSFYEFPVEPLEDEIRVYPNPATEQIVINTAGHTLIYNLWLYSSAGDKLFELRDLNEPVVAIDVQKLESGLYFLKASTSNGPVMRKIVVRHGN